MIKPGCSKVWEFFVINAVNNKHANCIICSEKISRGGHDARTFGTSSMINHLRSKHPLQFKVFQNSKQKQASDVSELVKKQKTLEFFLEKKKDFDTSDERHLKITK